MATRKSAKKAAPKKRASSSRSRAAMIKVRIQKAGGGTTVTVEEGTTVGEVLDVGAAKGVEYGGNQVRLNGDVVTHDEVLDENCTLALEPKVQGGTR